jgi:Protein of unknown function (DUF3102)
MSEQTIPNRQLSAIVDDIKVALRHDTKNAIRLGDLLREMKASPEVKHGDWGPLLKSNFDFSENTARNYMKASEYAETKNATVAVLNLAPSVLYALARGEFDPEVERRILEAAATERVDIDRTEEIENDWFAEEVEKADEAERKAKADDAGDVGDADDEDASDEADDGGTDATDDDPDNDADTVGDDLEKWEAEREAKAKREAEEKAEAEALLDGPPPALPPPEPPAPSPKEASALSQFEEGVELCAKS